MPAYGSDLAAALVAGSGGALGGSGGSANGGLGGAGGAGIEIGATGMLTISGLDARGATGGTGANGVFLGGGGGGGGGGGSGGSWLLHAQSISSGAAISVRGGVGGNGGAASPGGSGPGGGGGGGAGGRVLLLPTNYTVGSIALGGIQLDGGQGGLAGGTAIANGSLGGNGTAALRPDATIVPAGQGLAVSSGRIAAGGISISFSTSALEVQSGGSATLNNSPLSLRTLTGGGAMNVEGSTSLSVGEGNASSAFGGVFNGTGTFSKVGTGSVMLAGPIGFTGVIAVNGGALNLATSGSFSSTTVADGAFLRLTPGGGKVLTTGSLSMGSSTARFDVGDNAVIVDYLSPSATPVAAINAHAASGYHGGAWDGPGINSSSVAASPVPRSIGLAEAADVFTVFPTSFLGRDIDSTSILLRFTLPADANLDGKVDTLDFNALAANFGKSGIRWSKGEFNYDGVVDTLDFNALAGNFGKQLPHPGNSAAMLPEPGSAALAVMATTAATAIAPRRRRAKSAPARQPLRASGPVPYK
jgi:hypothetical protein